MVRKKVIKIFREFLPKTKAKEIERTIYKITKNNPDIRQYQNLTRSIGSLLDPKSYIYSEKDKKKKKNIKIKDKFLSGKITSEELITTKYYDFFPKKWKKIKENQEKQYEEYHKEIKIKKGTHYCKMCKSSSVMVNRIQTRSADEQESIFISCLNCGYRFRL